MVIRSASQNHIWIRSHGSDLFVPWLLPRGTWLCSLPICLLHAPLGHSGRLHLPELPQQCAGSICPYPNMTVLDRRGHHFLLPWKLGRICNLLRKIPQGSLSSSFPKLGQKGNMLLPDPKVSSLLQYSHPQSPAAMS